MLLVRNTGRGFVDVSASSGSVFRQRWAGRGLAVGDINNDGGLDAVVSTSNGPAHVVLNQARPGNRWLTLKLVGRKSNRDGIGAEVRVVTDQGCRARPQARRAAISLRATSGCTSAWDPLRR